MQALSNGKSVKMWILNIGAKIMEVALGGLSLRHTISARNILQRKSQTR